MKKILYLIAFISLFTKSNSMEREIRTLTSQSSDVVYPCPLPLVAELNTEIFQSLIKDELQHCNKYDDLKKIKSMIIDFMKISKSAKLCLDNIGKAIKIRFRNNHFNDLKDDYKYTLVFLVDALTSRIITFYLQAFDELLFKYDDRYNALEVATKLGHISLAKILIQRGIDINTKHKHRDNAPLTIAIHNNYEEMVDLLISAGADVNLVANEPYLKSIGIMNITPVCYAVANNNYAMVKKLIEAGADVKNNSETISYCLAFDTLSVIIPDSQKFDFLFNVINHTSDSLLYNLVGQDKAQEILKALDDKKYEDLEKFIKFLEKQKALACIKHINGKSFYVYSGHPAKINSLLQILVENGLDVNCKVKELNAKSTLFMLACRDSDSSLIKLLLKHGADVNAKDENGKTAYDYASYKNKFLLNSINSSCSIL